MLAGKEAEEKKIRPLDQDEKLPTRVWGHILINKLAGLPW